MTTHDSADEVSGFHDSDPQLEPSDYDQVDFDHTAPDPAPMTQMAVDQSDVERSDSDQVAGQPDTDSGFDDPEAATQALNDGPVLDPVDDAHPETTGAG